MQILIRTVTPIAKVVDMNMDDFKAAMDVNLFSNVAICKAAIPHMSKDGRIVMVSSGLATIPAIAMSSYCW